MWIRLTQRACDAGATLLMKPTDQFYGERSSRVRDPFGHEWLLGHSIEAMSSRRRCSGAIRR